MSGSEGYIRVIRVTWKDPYESLHTPRDEPQRMKSDTYKTHKTHKSYKSYKKSQKNHTKNTPVIFCLYKVFKKLSR